MYSFCCRRGTSFWDRIDWGRATRDAILSLCCILTVMFEVGQSGNHGHAIRPCSQRFIPHTIRSTSARRCGYFDCRSNGQYQFNGLIPTSPGYRLLYCTEWLPAKEHFYYLKLENLYDWLQRSWLYFEKWTIAAMINKGLPAFETFREKKPQVFTIQVVQQDEEEKARPRNNGASLSLSTVRKCLFTG